LGVARWSDEIRTSTSRCCLSTAIAASARRCSGSCGQKPRPPGQPLRIHVERFNPALRLSERLGFTQIEDKGVYLFMEWQLAKSEV
jgi:hypothetical protein